LEPRLPIPNRTVKRARADDSVHLACESRSPPGHIHQAKNPGVERVPGFFVGGCSRTLVTVRAAREMDGEVE
jgi:hypothetical protein